MKNQGLTLSFDASPIRRYFVLLILVLLTLYEYVISSQPRKLTVLIIHFIVDYKYVYT